MRFTDRSPAVRPHGRIKQILIEELQNPDSAGSLVPTEASLIKRFKVSRAPIRRALKDLADERHVSGSGPGAPVRSAA